MRAPALAGLLAAAVVAAPAAAQVPIPQGDPGDAPRFVGGPATPDPVAGAGAVAPQHPFLAPDGRSNIHDDAYMSDTYAGGGPLGRSIATRSVLESRDCTSVTFDSRDRIVTVCVGLDRPVLTVKDPRTLRTLAALDLPPRRPAPNANVFGDFSGGGYFYLDEQDRAVLPTTDRHLWVVDTRGDALQKVRDVDLGLGGQDKVVSALPDWAGRVWFVTADGVVGTVARDADVVRRLPLGERISNSFAVDDTGGVYVVTDGALYRLDAAADGTPVATWRQPYDNVGAQKPGQTSPGSGTTPTLIGPGLVAITDNADPMNVVVYRRGAAVAGPREVCRHAVFAKGASATDNSLIGFGSSLVVENNHGYTGPLAVQGGKSTAPGIERIDFDAARGTCRRVWRSDERSPTVVPKLSLANGLVYAYTKDPTGDADVWYLTALSFRTGRTVFKALAGEGLGFNNNYAPVTLGPDGAAYVGVLGGLTRFADAEGTPPTPPTADTTVAGYRCVPRRARLRSFGVRDLRLGRRLSSVRSQYGGVGRRACITDGGTVRMAYDGRKRIRLVVSTGRGHVALGRRPGGSARGLRVRDGVVRRGRYLLGVRRGRIRFVGVTPQRVANAMLRRDLRRVGL